MRHGLAGARRGSTCRTPCRTRPPSCSALGPSPRRRRTGRDRAARGPLGAVRRRAGDDARRTDHRRPVGLRHPAGRPGPGRRRADEPPAAQPLRGPSPGAHGGAAATSIPAMPTTRRDWDAIVVGLGALGSGGRVLAEPDPRRRRPRARTVRARPRPRCLGGSQPDHPPVLPPARLRPARPAGLRVVGRRRGRGRRTDRHRDRGPGPVARRSRASRWPTTPTASPPRASRSSSWTRTRSGDAGRSGGWTTASPGCSRPQGGLADPNRGNAAHQRLAAAQRRDAPGSDAGPRHPRCRRRRARGRDRGRRPPDRPGHPGRRRLDEPAPRRTSTDPLPLTVTKEQVTYFACPDPAAFAPDRFPVWIWMDVPSFYGFPTYGEAGPEGGRGLRRPAGRPGHADVRPGRRGVRARRRRSWRPTCPAPSGRPSTRRRACTR